MRDPEPVQPLRPVVEVFSAINQELQVIEPRTELAERFAGLLVVTDEAEDELAFRLNQSDVVQPPVFTCVVVKHLEAQELRIPGCTDRGITDGQIDLDAAGNRRHRPKSVRSSQSQEEVVPHLDGMVSVWGVIVVQLAASAG